MKKVPFKYLVNWMQNQARSTTETRRSTGRSRSTRWSPLLYCICRSWTSPLSYVTLVQQRYIHQNTRMLILQVAILI